MKVDLERLRRSLARYVRAEENAVPVATGDLAALLAVVDAARNGVLAWSEGAYSDIDCGSLEAALEPFTPPADRAEEVDQWHAERPLVQFDTPQRLYPKPNPRTDARDRAQPWVPPNSRDWVRDQLANAGVMVQRQFRSDQERIAELESYRAAAERKFRQLLDELERAKS